MRLGIPAFRHQSDSMKDSKQKELIEEESRWVESKILTPDVLLFILKDEAQEIRAACFEKGHQETSTIPRR
ncbi:MAG TPA: hypothetical protein VFF64_17330 [Candidatus Eremiobacteraceae bacterium]|nr:hypothetical protein [Candidatus Eremiobacteraceae bacterium]